MSFIALKEFQKYSNVFQEETSLQQSYIDSSEDIIENYLGYKLPLQTYVSRLNGSGASEIQLRAKPIKNVFKVLINGVQQRLNDFETSEEFLYFKNGVFPEGARNITVVYEAGFDERIDLEIDGLLDGSDANNDSSDVIDGADVNNNEAAVDGGGALRRDGNNYIPIVILSSILRIAAILQAEADSNIGVTSKSFGESGARTFINYTDFSKYLSPISKYKLLRV